MPTVSSLTAKDLPAPGGPKTPMESGFLPGFDLDLYELKPAQGADPPKNDLTGQAIKRQVGPMWILCMT